MVATSDSSGSMTVERLGEVIETATTGFAAESDQLHLLPDLGALVRVGGRSPQPAYYGVVAFGETGGLDASRRAVRRGSGGIEDEEVYRRHPELEHVLRTIFSVVVVGYAAGFGYQHTLPAQPVPLHYSVHPCGRDEVAAFCANPRYLPMLLSASGDLLPEMLVASHLRWVDATLQDGHAWLAGATRRLARLMKRDYDRFVTIAQAIAPDI